MHTAQLRTKLYNYWLKSKGSKDTEILKILDCLSKENEKILEPKQLAKHGYVPCPEFPGDYYLREVVPAVEHLQQQGCRSGPLDPANLWKVSLPQGPNPKP